MVPTADLVPYAGNAKEHPEWQVEQIANSIDQFGFDDPIGVWHDKDGRPIIVEGHGRLLAAKQLGIEEVPVIALDHLDDEGRRAYTLAHNQTTLTSGFDEDMLSKELEKITDIDMGDFGFGDGATLEDFEGVEEDDVPEVDEDEPARTKRGNIYQLGAHRLMCGDSTSAADVSALMGDDTADMVLTDPPYNVDYSAKANRVATLAAYNQTNRRDTNRRDIANDLMSPAAFQAFLTDAFSDAFNHAKDGAAMYVWFSPSFVTEVSEAIKAAGVKPRQMLVWIKSKAVIGFSDYQNIYEPCYYGWKPGDHFFAPTRKETTAIDQTKIASMSREELRDALEDALNALNNDVIYVPMTVKSDFHPTTKPIRLFAHLLRNSSKPGDIVLDIFGGSGTTLIACEQMKRKCRMMELDEHYCDVIVERWENLTGKKAVLLTGDAEPAPAATADGDRTDAVDLLAEE